MKKGVRREEKESLIRRKYLLLLFCLFVLVILIGIYFSVMQKPLLSVQTELSALAINDVCGESQERLSSMFPNAKREALEAIPYSCLSRFNNNEIEMVENPNNCPADIAPIGNLDGIVNANDLALILGAWGSCYDLELDIATLEETYYVGEDVDLTDPPASSNMQENKNFFSNKLKEKIIK